MSSETHSTSQNYIRRVHVVLAESSQYRTKTFVTSRAFVSRRQKCYSGFPHPISVRVYVAVVVPEQIAVGFSFRPTWDFHTTVFTLTPIEIIQTAHEIVRPLPRSPSLFADITWTRESVMDMACRRVST